MFNSLAFIFFQWRKWRGGKIYRQGYVKSIKQFKRPTQLLPLPPPLGSKRNINAPLDVAKIRELLPTKRIACRQKGSQADKRDLSLKKKISQ
jgi:hypothetical protein